MEPEAHFVWLMGADSAASFHLWKDWQVIAGLIPIAIISRPGTRLTRALPFTRHFGDARIAERIVAMLQDLNRQKQAQEAVAYQQAVAQRQVVMQQQAYQKAAMEYAARLIENQCEKLNLEEVPDPQW
jgi:nicotinic acid mononucleotide adenylyltransferase